MAKARSSESGQNTPKRQMVVLEKMIEGSKSTVEPRQFQIHELANLTGHDEREVQRSLYILEGHKYVSPCPAGDFTSKTWQITKVGMCALDNLSDETLLRML